MKLKNAKQVLKAVAQVYTDHPDRFVALRLACDVDNNPVRWKDHNAYKFCAMGLLFRIRDEGACTARAMDRAAAAMGGNGNIVHVNNEEGREAIIALATRSAARL